MQTIQPAQRVVLAGVRRRGALSRERGVVRLLAVALLGTSAGIVTVGCSTCSGGDSSSEQIPAMAPVFVYQPGERVVAEYAGATFCEGVVSSVQGDFMMIAPSDGQPQKKVDVANVYALGQSGLRKDTWKPGEFGICLTAPSKWEECRVQKASATQVQVMAEAGKRLTVKPSELLVPTALTGVNLRHLFQTVDRAEAFAREVKEVGTPHRTPNWSPRAGESILVRMGASYYSAVVSETRPNLLLVHVMGSGQKPQAIGNEDAWPEPPVDIPVVEGGFACMRPSVGQSLWPIVRVEQLRQDKAIVINASGKELTVEQKDLLPFVPRKN